MKSLEHLLLCLWSTACLSIDASVKPYIVAYFALSLFKVAKGIVIFHTLSLYESHTNSKLHQVSVAVTICATRFEVSGQLTLIDRKLFFHTNSIQENDINL